MADVGGTVGLEEHGRLIVCDVKSHTVFRLKLSKEVTGMAVRIPLLPPLTCAQIFDCWDFIPQLYTFTKQPSFPTSCLTTHPPSVF